MSREILGEPSPPDPATSAGHPALLEFDLTTPSRSDETPPRRRPWQALLSVLHSPAQRRRWVTGGAVAGAGLLVGALAGSGLAAEHTRAEVGSQADRTVHLLAGLESGTQIAGPRPQLRLGLTVLNAGPTPVKVADAFLDRGTSALLMTGRPAVVPAGGTASIPVTFVPSCDANGGPMGDPSAEVRLTVQLADGGIREVRPDSLPASRDVSDLARSGCSLPAADQVRVWVPDVDSHGSVRLDLSRPASSPDTEPVQVDVDVSALSPAVQVTSTPPMPVTLAPGDSLTLRVRFAIVQCSADVTSPLAGSTIAVRAWSTAGVLSRQTPQEIVAVVAQLSGRACPHGVGSPPVAVP